MYEIIKYVKESGMSITINYDYEKDLNTIRVSRKSGVSVYAIDILIYGIDDLNADKENTLFENVKYAVKELENKRGIAI